MERFWILAYALPVVVFTLVYVVFRLFLNAVEKGSEKTRQDIFELEKNILELEKGLGLNAEQKATSDAPVSFDQIFAIGQECKSSKISAKLLALQDAFNRYQISSLENAELSSRINTYYLPTLEIALQCVIRSEKDKAASYKETEVLCIRAIDTILAVLDEHNAEELATDLMNLKVEVETMQNLAALRGDITPSLSVPQTDVEDSAKASFNGSEGTSV